MSVTISSAVKSNLLALQTISSEAAKSQNILSTGKKVNSALDNATSFFTASSLNSRSTSLSGLLDSVSNGVQTIQAANSGITSITKLVDQLKSTGQQALATASAYSSQAKSTTAAIVGATAADIRGSGTTTYTANTATAGSVVNDNAGSPAAITTSTLLKNLGTSITAGSTLNVNGTTITFKNGGTIGANDFDVGSSSTATVGNLLNKIDSIVGSANGTSTIASGAITFSTSTTADLSITSGGTGNALTALGLGSGVTQARTGTVAGSLDTHSLTFQVGSSAALSVTFGDPATTSGSVKSLDDLNSKLSTIGLSASVDSTGKLAFTTTSDTASKTFKVTSGDSATATTTGFATGAGTTSSAVVRGGAGADARDALVTQYNGLLDQINTLANDSSYNGLNLLKGDTLTLTFNEKNTSKLAVTGSDGSFLGLGLSKVSATDFNDGNGIQSVLTSLEGSKGALSSLSSRLGANLAVVQTRQDFTKTLANTLSTGADNLVNADLNEEATKLLALQTSQSLAQSALSLSNQAQQGVLRLLQ